MEQELEIEAQSPQIGREQLAPQEYYNQAVRYIANQKHRCVDPVGDCLYADGQGNYCAIGYFMPKGHKASKTNLGISALIQDYPELVEWVLPDGDPDEAELLAGRLQALHDVETYRQETGGGLSAPGWKAATGIATAFGLEPYEKVN